MPTFDIGSPFDSAGPIAISTDARPLKICVIASTYPRHNDDYAVPWLRESIRHIVNRGHRVTVLAPSFEGLKDHQIDGVSVRRFRYSPSKWERLTHEQGAPNRIRNPWYQLLGAPYVIMGRRAARRLAHQEGFDIVHVHWPFPHEPIGTAAKSVCGAPLIVTCHGAEFALARRKPWVRECLKRSLNKADVVIANSSDTASKIDALSGRNATVLPFGSTVNPETEDVTGGYIPNEVPRILFTGRLIQRKGVEYLLRAMTHVLRRLPAKLIITGDGDQRALLERLTDELSIRRHVEFRGFISNEQLRNEYASCDVWVNPSIIDDRGDTEGLGVGSIEAYSHGKPVVCSNVGGIPDAVIHEKTGLLVPEKQPSLLAEAIVSLLCDPGRASRMATAGRQLVHDRFSWDGITTRLEKLYFEALNRRNGIGSHVDRDAELPCVPTG